MLRRKFDEDDTTKPHRTPRNLLSYIRDQSLNDDFMPLLAKHYNNLKELISNKINISEIKDAKFIVELNNFSGDLILISKICSAIDIESRAHQANIEKSRDSLRKYNSKELIEMVGFFYSRARKYDEYFVARDWLPKLNGTPLVLGLFFNPFRHNSELPNEENICNLVAAFNIHDDFFKNFLNTFYSDGNEGMAFLGRSFDEVSSDYKNIKEIMNEVSKGIPKSAPEKTIRRIESKYKSLEKILEKHPATLYSATRKILNYLEQQKTTSIV